MKTNVWCVAGVLAWSASAWAQEEPERPEVEEGNTVETRALRERNASDATGTREIISGEELRTTVAPSVLDALAVRVPWLYGTSDGTGTFGIGPGSLGDFGTRGFGGSPVSRSVTVWDGFTDLNGVVGRPLPDFYVGALLEEIQVLSGGDSVRWGTGASSSVIQMRSRFRTKPGWELDTQVQGGGLRETRAQVAALGRVGSWSVSSAVTARTSRGASEFSDDFVSTAQAAARTKGGLGQLTARMRYGFMDAKNIGVAPELGTNQWFVSERGVGSLEWVLRRGTLASRVAVMGSMGRDRLYTGTALDDVQFAGRAEVTWRPGAWLQVLGGVAADVLEGQVVNRPSGATPEIEGTRTVAPWIELSSKPFEDLSLVAGGRAVAGLPGETLWLYKAGVSWWAWPGGQVRGRVSRDFTQPTIAQRYLLPVSNEELASEVVENAEVGVSQYVGNKLEVRVTGFQTTGKGLIVPTGVRPNVMLTNVQDAQFRGVEGIVIGRPVGWLELGGGGNWVDVGEVTLLNPSLRLSGWARGRWEKVSVSVRGQYVGGRFGGPNQTEPLEPIVDVGARVGWRPDPRVEVFAQGFNLLDVDNAPLSGSFSAGRRGYVGVRLRLESVKGQGRRVRPRDRP